MRYQKITTSPIIGEWWLFCLLLVRNRCCYRLLPRQLRIVRSIDAGNCSRSKKPFLQRFDGYREHERAIWIPYCHSLYIFLWQEDLRACGRTSRNTRSWHYGWWRNRCPLGYNSCGWICWWRQQFKFRIYKNDHRLLRFHGFSVDSKQPSCILLWLHR